MNKVIILGNDHTNTLGLTQTLGKTGYETYSYVWGRNTGIVKSSRYCTKLYTSSTKEEAIDKILKTKEFYETPTPIIASCDDAAFLLEDNAEKLQDRFVFEHTISDYSISELLEKKLQVKLALSAGFNVPKSWIGVNKENIPSDIIFPCLIKPQESRLGAKSDIHICDDYYVLEKRLCSLERTADVIVQQYIDHDYEISILGCALKNGDVVIPCVENKLTLYPKYVGLECLADMQPLNDSSIIEPIKKIICESGYIGVFSVEMMHNKVDDKFYFTEINLRNDGANTFVYKCGVNLPHIHICDLIGKKWEIPQVSKPGFYIWDFHHFMSLIHRDMSLYAWIKEIVHSNGFLTFFLEDRKPFVKQYTNWFLEKIRFRKVCNY